MYAESDISSQLYKNELLIKNIDWIIGDKISQCIPSYIVSLFVTFLTYSSKCK